MAESIESNNHEFYLYIICVVLLDLCFVPQKGLLLLWVLLDL